MYRACPKSGFYFTRCTQEELWPLNEIRSSQPVHFPFEMEYRYVFPDWI